VIVSWNTRALLESCLDSLDREGRSGGPRLEVTVVDNGSTDGSVEMVAARRPPPRLIANAENRGFSAANNQGLAEATAPLIFLLNSDTEVEPGGLRALVDYARDHPRAGILGPQLLNPDGSLQPSGGRLPRLGATLAELLGLDRLGGRPRYGTRRDYSVPSPVEEVSGAALLIRAAVVEAVGGLDEGFRWGYEDVDLCRRAAAAGWEIHYVSAARVRHEWGASRRLAPAATVARADQGRRYYFRKHHGPVAAALVTAATLVSHLLRAAVFAVAGGIWPRFRGRAAVEWQASGYLLGRES
jgi:hypothetical protein